MSSRSRPAVGHALRAAGRLRQCADIHAGTRAAARSPPRDAAKPHRRGDRSGAGRRASQRGESCPRRAPASARHAAVLRHQARHDGGRGVARRRRLVHRDPRAAAGGYSGKLYRGARCRAEPRQRIRHGPASRAFTDKLAARAGALRQGRQSPRWVPATSRSRRPAAPTWSLTFRNLHNWMELGFATRGLRGDARALKPGGVLGRGGTSCRSGEAAGSARATNGYVNEDVCASS